MIWTAEDFKGLAKGSLKMSPGAVSIITGANSGGKSSLIQSVLFVAQSIQTLSPLTLNGALVRLGDAKDLVRDGATTTRLEIEFTPQRVAHGSPRIVNVKHSLLKSRDTIKVSFELKPGLTDGTMALKSVLISTVENHRLLELTTNNARGEDIEYIRSKHEDDLLNVLRLKNHISSPDRPVRTYAAFSGLVPVSLTRLLNEGDAQAKYRRELSAALVAHRSMRSEDQESLNVPVLRQVDIYSMQEEIEHLLLASDTVHEETLGSLASSVREGVPVNLGDLASLPGVDRTGAVDALARLRAKQREIQIPIRDRWYGSSYLGSGPAGLLEQTLERESQDEIEVLGQLKRTLRDLGRQVQYLGPLRDEPRVVWSQWNEQPSGLPVGLRGELSASVLSRQASREVHCRLPGDTNPQVHTLQHAVSSWLDFLQLAKGVSTVGRGKLGVEVTLHSDNGKRDLTSVGVGVSQTLPIVVALLVAPRNSVLIVEQPELHLHPSVQARLSDFLLTARPDVSVVAETHSEALLTRIRRRVAEGQRDPSRVQILFVEPADNGATCRELSVNSMGDLSEWPKGFLSDIEEDTRAIILASMKRAGVADV